MINNVHEIRDFMLELVEEASTNVRKSREESSFKTKTKGNVRNIVTSADISTEALVINAIRKRFPSHQILSEESSPEIKQAELFYEPLWIIDPIDGTNNFAHGLAHVGVSIAYAEKGEVQAGVVGCPFLGETFSAVRGEGAFLNGEKISVSDVSSLAEALVSTGFPYERDEKTVDVLTARVRAVLLNCKDIRRAGAATIDICYVACGRHDAFYETLNTWDIAAACLIAREAGAEVRSLDEVTPEWGEILKSIPRELYPRNLVVAPRRLMNDFFSLLEQAGR